MTFQSTKDRLMKAFEAETPFLSGRQSQLVKKSVFDRIAKLHVQREERDLKRVITSLYQAPSLVCEQRLKRQIMSALPDEPQTSIFADLMLKFRLFAKKALAVTFSFVLISSFLISPWQTSMSPDLFTEAKAAYLACSGTVFVNGTLCNTETLLMVKPGDAISTDHYSEATIVYADSTVVRLDKTTVAAIDGKASDQIHVQQGVLWLNAKSRSDQNDFALSTPNMKVRIPEGMASIETKGNTTQFFTSTGVAEVRIENSQGVTELLALAPEKKMTVRQHRARTQVRRSILDEKSIATSRDNGIKDQQYLDMVKKKFPLLFVADRGGETPRLTQNLLTAHQALNDGRRDIASDALNMALILIENAPDDRLAIDRMDLAILEDMTGDTKEVSELLALIEKRMTDQIRMLSLQKPSSEVMGNSVSGVAL